MTYEQPEQMTRQQALSAVASSSPDDAASAIISIALYEPDRIWAENFCLASLSDDRDMVATAAVTGLGHLARLHRQASIDVIGALRALRQGALNGVVEDALDDIGIFSPSQQ